MNVTVGEAVPALRHDVSATTIVLGALASRDWRPMHHDHDFAVHRNGTKDIFMNTPNQAAWFERYLTDWTGDPGAVELFKTRFSAMVVVPADGGNTVTVGGKISGMLEGDRVRIDVVATTPDGATVAKGEAIVALA